MDILDCREASTVLVLATIASNTVAPVAVSWPWAPFLSGIVGSVLALIVSQVVRFYDQSRKRAAFRAQSKALLRILYIKIQSNIFLASNDTTWEQASKRLSELVFSESSLLALGDVLELACSVTLILDNVRAHYWMLEDMKSEHQAARLSADQDSSEDLLQLNALEMRISTVAENYENEQRMALTGISMLAKKMKVDITLPAPVVD